MSRLFDEWYSDEVDDEDDDSAIRFTLDRLRLLLMCDIMKPSFGLHDTLRP